MLIDSVPFKERQNFARIMVDLICLLSKRCRTDIMTSHHRKKMLLFFLHPTILHNYCRRASSGEVHIKRKRFLSATHNPQHMHLLLFALNNMHAQMSFNGKHLLGANISSSPETKKQITPLNLHRNLLSSTQNDFNWYIQLSNTTVIALHACLVRSTTSTAMIHSSYPAPRRILYTMIERNTSRRRGVRSSQASGFTAVCTQSRQTRGQIVNIVASPNELYPPTSCALCSRDRYALCIMHFVVHLLAGYSTRTYECMLGTTCAERANSYHTDCSIPQISLVY